MKDIIIGVIPARGGSKGIPGKNIKAIGGKPLIQYTIEAARKSRLLTDFFLSSDSRQIISVAKKIGCRAPFVRPKFLSGDKASTLDVVKHAVESFEKAYGGKIWAAIVLQPTSPFRTAQDIDTSIRLLKRRPSADSVVSFFSSTRLHPNYMYLENGIWVKPLLNGSETTRRQDFKPILIRNGAIYLAKRSTIFMENSLTGKKIVPYLMPENRSVNIDEPMDFTLAEVILKNG